MNDRNLLPCEGQFYKANLHCHTVLSDGKWTKEQVKEEYKKRGYSVVAFTDHRHYGWHPELMDEGFIPLAGFEADLNDWFKAPGDFKHVRCYHLLLWDKNPTARKDYQAQQPPRRYGDIHSLNEYLYTMQEQGFLTCYNHPYWSLQSYPDYAHLSNLNAMEIYNHGCEHDGLYGYAPQAYDEMLRQGLHIGCVATDDNHNSYPPDHPLSDAFGGWVMLKLESLTYENVIHALEKGHYYASTGPEMQEVYIKDDIVHIKCSPVKKIYVATDSRNCYHKVAAQGEYLTEASFPLKGDEGYIRVDCEDEYRRHAYSNAYFLDEL